MTLNRNMHTRHQTTEAPSLRCATIWENITNALSILLMLGLTSTALHIEWIPFRKNDGDRLKILQELAARRKKLIALDLPLTAPAAKLTKGPETPVVVWVPEKV